MANFSDCDCETQAGSSGATAMYPFLDLSQSGETSDDTGEWITYEWLPTIFWSAGPEFGSRDKIRQILRSLRADQRARAESVSRSNTVGQMGGSISDGYATVTAPRGAVDNDVKLAVTDRSPPSPVPLEGHPEVSMAGLISCMPSGMNFNRDVSIERQLPEYNADMHKIRIVYIPQGHGNKGKTLPEDYCDITDSCGLTIHDGRLKFKVDHFSDYAILLFAVAASAIAGTIAGTVLGATVTYSIMQDLQGHVSTVRSATMMVKAYVTFNARRAPGSFKVAFGAHEDEFEDYGHFPLLEIGPMDVSSWTGKGVSLKPTMEEEWWRFENASRCAGCLYTADSPPVVLEINSTGVVFRRYPGRCQGKLILFDSSNPQNRETQDFRFLATQRRGFLGAILYAVMPRDSPWFDPRFNSRQYYAFIHILDPSLLRMHATDRGLLTHRESQYVQGSSNPIDGTSLLISFLVMGGSSSFRGFLDVLSDMGYEDKRREFEELLPPPSAT
eukprot:scpid72506/ scgid1753/ 